MRLLQRPLSLEFAIPPATTGDENDALIASELQTFGDAVASVTWSRSHDPPTVTIVGHVPPSQLHCALRRAVGPRLPVILRGQGSQLPNSSIAPTAAVCILEHYEAVPRRAWAQYDNCGLARLVQLDENVCLVDLAVHGWPATAAATPPQLGTNGLPEPTHAVELHELGDISRGEDSVGPVFPSSAHGRLGELYIDPNTGRGSLVVETAHVSVHDLIGRSLVVRSLTASAGGRVACGVIARSAGLFQNVKTVCSCSGKTLWNEAQAVPPLR